MSQTSVSATSTEGLLHVGVGSWQKQLAAAEAPRRTLTLMLKKRYADLIGQKPVFNCYVLTQQLTGWCCGHGQLAERLAAAEARGRTLTLKLKRRKAGAPEPRKFLGACPARLYCILYSILLFLFYTYIILNSTA